MTEYITKKGVIYSPTCVHLEKHMKSLAKERKINMSALLTRALKAELGEIAL